MTGSFNVNGMRNQSNNFLLDGASNNDTFNTGFVLRPPPDAIQEFKILTHSYSAEYGRNAGSVVNVVTKSGTNRWHGGAWEFNRDDALQARNFFAPTTQPKPELKQNQFGASLGGPLATQQAVRVRLLRGLPEPQRHHDQTLVVLSPEQRRGDFSGSRPCPRSAHRAAVPREHHPRRRASDPVAQKLLTDFVPLPNVPRQPLHGVAERRGRPRPGRPPARLPT